MDQRTNALLSAIRFQREHNDANRNEAVARGRWLSGLFGRRGKALTVHPAREDAELIT